eukprot:Gb_19376 [translate_table: standard]
MPTLPLEADLKKKHIKDRSTSNYSYEEVELLEEEIEEESLVLSEVYRIKEILAKPGKSTNIIFESLRRLELMQLSVEILKAIEVGKLVNSLRRHNSKEIWSLDVSKDIGQFFDGIDDEEYSLQQGTNSLKKMSKPCASSSNDAVNLEATKKKLQEGYRQSEHVKRQRTFQMLDLKDLPKQKPSLRRR